MRVLRIFLSLLLAIALAATTVFAFAIHRLTASFSPGGEPDLEAVFLASFALFLLMLIPLGAIHLWANTQASSIDAISRRIRELLRGDRAQAIDAATMEGEVGELAQAVEELRRVLVGQIERVDQQKVVTRQILDGLGEGLIAIDATRNIVLINARATEIFSVPPHLTGHPYLQLIRNPVLNECFDKALTGAEASGRTLVAVGERERLIEVRTFPLTASPEIAAAALLIDVTEMARLEAIRRNFLDDFSHEVRTPLAGLRSAIDSFAAPTTPHQEERLRQIVQRQLGRLERLVHDIAELNRIESGEIVLQREATDVHRLLRDLAGDFSAAAAKQGIEIHVSGEDSTIEVDPVKVQQIFSNLIDNAILHSGRAGRIDVTVEDLPNDTVVRVSDHGEGIPDHDGERIFHRFYRVDRSRSETPGTGLGLAIVKHLVLRHGGSVRVESRPGEGATFVVKLPKQAVSRPV